MEAKIDKMLEAGIISSIHPRDICFIAQMVLAQKAHERDGLTIEELKHQVNDQCIEQGLPSEFEMPPQPEPIEPREKTMQDKPKKWQMCQDFGEINKVTEIAPVPQGDIRVKQLHLSGHWYIHIFDFAAGFYGIKIHPESQPYIMFYIEGCGYFAYKCMPFGVTRGPSKFRHITAERFHDLVAKSILELFVDDGGVAMNSFKEGMCKLRTLLERVCREKMSLSPSKLKLFMSKAVFTGA